MLKYFGIIYCLSFVWVNANTTRHQADLNWQHCQSLKIQLCDKKGRLLSIIDGDAIHQNLHLQEIQTTPCCYFNRDESEPNTLVTTVTAIIKTKENTLKIITQDLTLALVQKLAAETENHFLFFISRILIGYCEKGRALSLLKNPLWFNPKDLYPKNESELKPFLEELGHDFSNPNHPPATRTAASDDNQYSDSKYNHTEHKLLYFLLKKDGLLKVISVARDGSGTCIGLVLHIHSRYDPCSNCAKSLLHFKEYVQKTIFKNPNIPLLVTVSSRTPYSGSLKTWRTAVPSDSIAQLRLDYEETPKVQNVPSHPAPVATPTNKTHTTVANATESDDEEETLTTTVATPQPNLYTFKDDAPQVYHFQEALKLAHKTDSK